MLVSQVLFKYIKVLRSHTLIEKDLESYTYEMIGGNHSRTVLQKVIDEPMLRLEASLHHRLAVVYQKLTDEET